MSREDLPGVVPFGGISEQPPHAALPSQVKDAVNVRCDIATGLVKRAGTIFERKFSGKPNGDLRSEMWSHSASEKYRVVFGLADSATVLRIFRKGGGEATVTISGAASTYLNLNYPTSDQLRVVPCDGFLMVSNATVATSLIQSDDYSVLANRPDYESAVCLTVSIGDRVKTLADSASAKAGHYQYQPTYGYGHRNFAVLTTPWSIAFGYWDDSGYFPVGFRIAFRRLAPASFTGGVWDSTARTLAKTDQFLAYTYRSGDQIFISGGTGFTAGKWYKIESKIDKDTIKLAAQTGIGGSNTSDVASTDGAGVSPIGIEVEVNLDISGGIAAGKTMHWIAAQIQDALRNGGAANACCAWYPQNVGGSFQVTGPYRGSASFVYAPTAPTQTVGASGDLTAAGRPFDASASSGVAGSGSIGTDSDSETPESRWVRVAPPKQATGKLDPATMPVKITRTSADNFSVDVVDWSQRASGTTTTNPGSKFFTTGQKVADMAWYKERLFLGGGPNVAGSRIGKPFDFWVEDVAEPVDSDPIDKTIPAGGKGGVLFFTEFANAIVIFCAEGQYEMTSADQPLTPTTAQLIASTAYAVSNVRPRVGTTQVFFAAPTGPYSVIAEYFQDQLRVASEAAEVTSHVPKLIPSRVRSIVPVPGVKSVLVTPTDSASIYVYQYFFDGAQKVQSAWSRFLFDDGGYRICDVVGSDNEAAILNEVVGIFSVSTGACRLALPSHGYSNGDPIWLTLSTTTPNIDGKRYVKVIDTNTVEIYTDAGLTSLLTITVAGTVRWHSGSYIFEQLPLEAQAADTGYPCSVHMDRKLTLTGIHSAGTTTFTLPSSPSVATGSAQLSGFGSTLNKIVLGPAFGANAGNVVAISGYTTTTVTVAGNYSAGPVVLGRFFYSSATLFRPFIRNAQGRADTRKTLSIVSLAVSLWMACAIRVKLVRPLQIDRTRDFDNGSTPHPFTTLETWLEGDAEGGTYTIEDVSSDTATRPWAVTCFGWDVEYTPDGGGQRGG